MGYLVSILQSGHLTPAWSRLSATSTVGTVQPTCYIYDIRMLVYGNVLSQGCLWRVSTSLRCIHAFIITRQIKLIHMALRQSYVQILLILLRIFINIDGRMNSGYRVASNVSSLARLSLSMRYISALGGMYLSVTSLELSKKIAL